jgi:hypothetical protein
MLFTLYKKVDKRERDGTLSLKNYSSNYGAEDKVMLSKYPPVVQNCVIL